MTAITLKEFLIEDEKTYFGAKDENGNDTWGSSAHKMFNKNAEKATQPSTINPETATIGHMVHKFILEGPEEFFRAFMYATWSALSAESYRAIQEVLIAEIEEAKGAKLKSSRAALTELESRKVGDDFMDNTKLNATKKLDKLIISQLETQAQSQGRRLVRETSTVPSLSTLERMRDRVMSHKVAGPLYGEGVPERVGRRVHTIDGGHSVTLQCRLDWYNPVLNHVADLKTIDDIMNMERAIAKWDYPWQAGHYQYVCEEYVADPYDWSFVFIEKVEPYICGVVRIPKDCIQRQVDRVRASADRLAAAIATNRFPNGYENEYYYDDFTRSINASKGE